MKERSERPRSKTHNQQLLEIVHLMTNQFGETRNRASLGADEFDHGAGRGSVSSTRDELEQATWGRHPVVVIIPPGNDSDPTCLGPTRPGRTKAKIHEPLARQHLDP